MEHDALTKPALEALLQAPSLAVLAVDQQGRVIMWSPSAARMFGWTESEVLGRFIPITLPERRQQVHDRIQATLRGDTISALDVQTRHKDGSLVDVSVWTAPLRDDQGAVIGLVAVHLDISARRQAEEQLERRVRERTADLAKATAALRESEARYRALVENIPAITYTTAQDKTYTTLYVSPQVEAVLGFTPAEVTADPDFWPKHVHPDDYHRIIAEAERAFAGGEPFDGEYRILDREGTILWVRDRAAVIRNEAGQPVLLQGVLFDITKRRRAEETARLQSTALEAASNGIVITDRDGRLLWANPAFTKLTGYGLVEVLGQSLRLLKSGRHDRAFYQKLWATVRAGQVWHGEMINKRKDGSLYNEEMTITPVRDAAGQIARFIAIKQDITEWKQAEESRRHLAAIVESSDDAIFSADLDGTITSWNAGAERLYDYTAAEVLGRPVSLLAPRDRKGEIRQVLQTLRRGEHVEHFETVRLKKGGVPVAVSVTVSPIKNETGHVIGVSVINCDITQRKELEQAVVEASSREQRRIGQDLHDGLCQQLTGLSFLWKTIAESDAVRAMPNVAPITAVSQLITKTIGEARDLARGLCPVELERNDLAVALKNLGLSTERLFAVSCVVHCQRPVRLADKLVATHLYRIAQEALSNAIHHGKASRVRLHLVWRNKRLTLRIRDNGSGFSTRRGLKEGIGIRSMKYRAQAIGGSLTIESKRTAGTTVTCTYRQPSA